MSELYTNNNSDEDWIEPNFFPRIMLLILFIPFSGIIGIWSILYIAFYGFKYYSNNLIKNSFGSSWIFYEILVVLISVIFWN